MSESIESDTLWVTQEAYDRLRDELANLKGPVWEDITTKIAAARDEGDLKENGGYHAAREEQGKTKARIDQLEQMLNRAEVGESPAGRQHTRHRFRRHGEGHAEQQPGSHSGAEHDVARPRPEGAGGPDGDADGDGHEREQHERRRFVDRPPGGGGREGQRLEDHRGRQDATASAARMPRRHAPTALLRVRTRSSR